MLQRWSVIGLTTMGTDGNPAFTVYDVDPDTYDIMDVKVYIGELESLCSFDSPFDRFRVANMTKATYHEKRKDSSLGSPTG